MKNIRTQFQLTKVLLQDITHKELSSSERLLLAILSTYTNPAHNWQGWPSIEELMKDSGLGRAGVHKVLKSLRDKKVISTLSGMSGRCSHYIIHVDKITESKYAKEATLDSKRKGSEESTKSPDFDDPF